MEPDVCLFIFPEARVCGAEQHLIRLLGIWELLFTEPPEQKRARQEGQGGEGKETRAQVFRWLQPTPAHAGGEL